MWTLKWGPLWIHLEWCRFEKNSLSLIQCKWIFVLKRMRFFLALCRCSFYSTINKPLHEYFVVTILFKVKRKKSRTSMSPNCRGPPVSKSNEWNTFCDMLYESTSIFFCYRPQRGCGKVIFSQASVIHSVHRGGGSLSGQGLCQGDPPRYGNERAVRILRECILVKACLY